MAAVGGQGGPGGPDFDPASIKNSLKGTDLAGADVSISNIEKQSDEGKQFLTFRARFGNNEYTINITNNDIIQDLVSGGNQEVIKKWATNVFRTMEWMNVHDNFGSVGLTNNHVFVNGKSLIGYENKLKNAQQAREQMREALDTFKGGREKQTQALKEQINARNALYELNENVDEDFVDRREQEVNAKLEELGVGKQDLDNLDHYLTKFTEQQNERQQEMEANLARAEEIYASLENAKPTGPQAGLASNLIPIDTIAKAALEVNAQDATENAPDVTVTAGASEGAPPRTGLTVTRISGQEAGAQESHQNIDEDEWQQGPAGDPHQE